MTGIDLSAEVERELQKNAGRAYASDERGVMNRLDSTS